MNVFEAVKRGDIEFLNSYIQNYQINKNEKEDSDSDSSEDEETSPFNILDDKCNTPLHIAVSTGNLEVIELLLREKSQTDVYNSEGLAPLHEAVLQNKPEIVKLLVNVGKANVDLMSLDSIYLGYTPLHYACSNHNKTGSTLPEMAKLLLELGANINKQAHDGSTPLHLAVKSDIGIVRLLIENGADVNIGDRCKVTPIMIAATLGREDCVEVLLQSRKVDFTKTDQNGDSALHFAFQSQLQRLFPQGIEVTAANERIAYRLVKMGANIDVKSNDGILPTDFCSKDFATILEILSKYRSVFPEDISCLYAINEDVLQKLPRISHEEKRKLIEAINSHRIEFDERAEREMKRRGCLMVQANKHLKKDIKHILEAPKSSSVSAMPFGQTPFNFGNTSGGKCPLGFTKQTEEKVDEQKAKCPIPFHNQLLFLKAPLFWLSLVAGVAGIVVAKYT